MLAEKNNLVNSWLKKGGSEEPVAVFGTSIEFVCNALETGYLDWTAPHENLKLLPYQRKLLRQGGYLYYTFPILEGLEHFSPVFAQYLREEGLKENADFSRARLEASAGRYACAQGIRHAFEYLFGASIESSEVVGLALLLAPGYWKKNIKDGWLEEEFDIFPYQLKWREPILAGKYLPDNMTVGNARTMLTNCISRRGVLVYLNSSALQEKLLKGYEIEEELLIHSQKPLGLQAISGIIPQSTVDRKALFERLQIS